MSAINTRFKMKKNTFVSLLAMAVVFGAVAVGSTATAQTRPDFSGMWIGPSPDITVSLLPGEEISFTAYGAERYKKLDQADSPSYRCLPYGPTRSMMSTWPYLIVQTPTHIAVLNENVDYRVFYIDGKHPDDILDYAEWNGHSIARWEGDTLLVDTIGIRPETWLDTAGLEHSEKLHLTERFQKTGPDALKWTVTIEDPVFFTHPFTYERTIRRMPKDARLMTARCADGEGSLENAQRGHEGPEHKNPPKLPK
jgi:hypothetical protein